MTDPSRPAVEEDTAPVRVGEEIDAGAIARFLRTCVPGLEGTPEVLQFAGGASNLTYLLRYPDRDLVLRRPPFGHKAKSAHDVLREARILRALAPEFPLAPTVVAACDDPSILGADFFVMERMPGLILRRDIPESAGLDAAATRRLCEHAIDTLAALHAAATDAPGLRELGRGPGYVRRQLDGWTDRFRRARTPDVGDFEAVITWLLARRPLADAGMCLIHNDFRFDNLVLDPGCPTRIAGVLDWEMATIGDPLMDLGNALAYWVEAGDDADFRRLRRQPTNAPGMLTRAEVVARYAGITGRRTDAMAFYEVFGLFRLAGIAQQIYRRFRDGDARNPAFAAFGAVVSVLEARCRDLMNRS